MTFQSAQSTKSRYATQALKRLVVYTSLLAGIVGGICASASTPTTATLAVTSGGTAVTTVASGNVVTLTATVKAGSTAVTTGQVNFCDATAKYCTDIHLLGTAQLTSNGTASLKFIPGIGVHSFKAVFWATTSSAGSTSATTSLTVTGQTPTFTLIGRSGSKNDAFSATVTGVGRSAPSGTASFVDTSSGNTTLDTAPLVPVASTLSFLSMAPLTTGNGSGNLVVGDFNGDGIPDIAVTNFWTANTVFIYLGKGDGTFTKSSQIDVGWLPDFLTVGDFNNDGKTDLAVTYYYGVSVLLGNGDGTFTSSSTLSDINAESIAAGDFNGDGKADLAVVNGGTITSSGTITIFLGNGDGTFTAAPSSPTTGKAPGNLVVGDFNGDGKADLAVPNWSDSTVTVLLGNGDGTFTSAPNVSNLSYPSAIAVVDFNQDGKVDLAIVNSSDNKVQIMRGNGDGTFTPVATPGINPYSTSIAVGDFNLDGIPDLAVTSSYSNDVTILLGKGDGTFANAPAIPSTGNDPTCIALADFNGDGINDIAALNYNSQTITLLLTQITETSSATAPQIAPTWAGSHQIAAAYPGDSAYGPSSSSSISVPPVSTTTNLAITSNGNPVSTVAIGKLVTLTATVANQLGPVSTGQVNFCDATAVYCTDIHLLGSAELNGSGIASFSLSPSIGNHSYKAIFQATINDTASDSTTLSLAVTGKFPTSTAIAQSGAAGNYTLTATVVGSIDNQGQAGPTGTVSFLDTSNANYQLGSAALGKTTSGLSFPNSSTPTTGNSPLCLVAADFNRDGIPDMAVVNSGSNSLSILLGKGDGTFTAAASPATGVYPFCIAEGDFNGDGIPDLVVTNSGDDSVTILLGKGDGTFSAASSLMAGAGPTSIAVGDFNQDGKMDIAVLNTGYPSFYFSIPDNSVTLFLGNGDGTFIRKSSSQTGNLPQSITEGDFNGDGILDLAVANSNDNTVTVLLGNGDGTFTASPTSPATGTYPNSIVEGDFNGDGKADLAVSNASSNSLTILLGNGDGTFSDATASPATGNGPTSISEGDFNGDGKADLAVANSADNTVTVLLGNGDGTFHSVASPQTGKQPYFVTAADFDGDGITDLAASNYSGNTLSIFLSHVTQTATATVSFISPTGTGTHQVVASYPGDTTFTSSISSATGLTASPTATPTVTITLSSTSITTAQVLTVTVGVSDGTANPTPTGAVTLTSGTYTSTATTLNGGSAKISVPAGSLAVGTDTLSATYTPDATSSTLYGSASNTASVTVTTAPPSFALGGTSVTVTPGATTGDTSTITVTPSGGFTGSVALTAALTSSPAGAQYPPTLSFGSTTPVSITGTTAGTATLTISTTAPTSAELAYPKYSGEPWYATGGATLACLLLFGIRVRRRNWRTMLGFFVLMTFLAGGVLSCGGGGGGGGGGGTSNPGTTAGAYTVTVTGTSGSLTQTTTVTVTVN